MTYAAIKSHIDLDNDYTGAEEKKIWRSIRDAYVSSPQAAAMFDKLGATEADVYIEKTNDFAAYIGSNKLLIGTHYLNTLTMIDARGHLVEPNFQIALLHEFSHALNNLEDPTADQLANFDYVGDNVRAENVIRDELGFLPRTSYYCIESDSFFENNPAAFTHGYTNGQRVDLIVISHADFGHNITTTGQGTSRDLLLGAGGDTGNVLKSGAGDDFLYGYAGADTLDAGDGDDYLLGGADKDILIAGAGNNVMDGGAGKDVAELSGFKFMRSVTNSDGWRLLVDGQTGQRDLVRNVETFRYTAKDQPLPSEITSSFVTHSQTVLAPNDDGYEQASLTQAFEKGFNFFGTTYTAVYVNNNGNLTFGGGLSSFTPGSIGGGSGLPIVAAFWADVDTRDGGGTVSYGYNSAHDSFVATWSNVDYYNATLEEHVSLSNSYQIEIFDQGAGDAEIIIRYGALSWTTGDASGGTGGHGGSVARAGVNSGNAIFQYEMPGSGNEGSMLSLTTDTNCDRAGVYRFSVHNGTIIEEGVVAGAQNAADLDWAFV